MASGRQCALNLCDGPVGKPDNVQATVVTRFRAGPTERREKVGTCWPHDSTTDSPVDYLATCAQMATHVMVITLLMPVALQWSFDTERIRNALPRSTGSCLATSELQGVPYRTTIVCCGCNMAPAPGRAATTYSASYSGILVGLRQRVAGTSERRHVSTHPPATCRTGH